MNEELFFTCKGVKLSAVLEMPSATAPIVILCHGFSSRKESSKFLALAPALAKAGIGSFRFDFYGHGASGGLFENVTLTAAIAEVKAAVRYLRRRFPRSRIGLLGSSFGGAACFYAARASQAKAMMLLCPAILYRERYFMRYGPKGIAAWKKKGWTPYKSFDGRVLKLKYGFYESLLPYDGLAEAEKLAMPVVIMHGYNDQLVDYGDSVAVALLLPKGKLRTVKGADHYFRRPGDLPLIVKETVSFFKKTFK